MKKKKPERAFWAFDTEDNSQGSVRIINFYDGTTHHTFHWKNEKFADDAIQFLASQKDAEFWSCNLQYDLVNTFKDEISLLNLTFIGSRIIVGQWEGLYFKDTLNHWKISVAEMGKRIGLPKLESNGDFDNIEYCQRDTEIVWKFVQTMKTKYATFGAKLKPTIGSTAMDLFSTKFFKRIKKNPFTTRELEFMKRGYYGGRTEIFFNRPVEGRIFYSDFNSLYPACMLGNFPLIYENNFRKFRSRKRSDLESGLPGFVDCTVETPENLWIPYLPYRDPKSFRLTFPLGRFRGVWTTFELLEAEKLGYRIRTIHSGLFIQSTSLAVFERYVRDLFGRRDIAKAEKDDLLSDAFKLVMNNLYGKFGQGREITKSFPFTSKKDLKNGDLVVGDLVLRNDVSKKYPEHTNFIWPALVTAKGRDKLWSAMTFIHDRGGRLIYCDTDSVIYEAKENLFPDSAELGDLKLEGIFAYAHFKLPKQYVLAKDDGKKSYKTKGVPRAKAEEFFETGRTTFEKPFKLKESWRRQASKSANKIQANVWAKTEKITKQIYDKRIVLSDGNTEPLEIK